MVLWEKVHSVDHKEGQVTQDNQDKKGNVEGKVRPETAKVLEAVREHGAPPTPGAMQTLLQALIEAIAQDGEAGVLSASQINTLNSGRYDLVRQLHIQHPNISTEMVNDFVSWCLHIITSEEVAKPDPGNELITIQRPN